MMLPLGILFIIVLIIGFVIASIYLRTSRPRTDTTSQFPLTIDWDAMADEVLQAALANGSKIEAIKVYRQITGVGLKDAKDAIEYALLHPDESRDKKKKAAYDEQDAGIRDLVREGRLDEAVEVYQKFAGVDTYTARDAVADIERDIHLTDDTASHTTFEVPPPNKASKGRDN